MSPPTTEHGTATGAPTSPPVAWQRRWETELDGLDHAAVAELLARSFPTVTDFADGQSWTGARPELRVIDPGDGHPVAHAGIVRRFLRFPDAGRSVLVGDVGLVAVDPARQGHRLGTALMAAVADTLADLDLPYGFLTCGTERRPFYEHCGWTALHDRPLAAVPIRHLVPRRRGDGMVLPVLASLSQWPGGPMHRDGQEI